MLRTADYKISSATASFCNNRTKIPMYMNEIYLYFFFLKNPRKSTAIATASAPIISIHKAASE